jgi:hypothetical protein
VKVKNLVSKLIWSKIWGYLVTVAGVALFAMKFADLTQGDRWVALILVIPFFLFLLVPVVVFGASIRPGDLALKVSQYTDTEVSYEKVRGCYRYFFPPFQLVLITTRRRFPLNVLISGDGTIMQRGTLAENVRNRIRQHQGATPSLPSQS